MSSATIVMPARNEEANIQRAVVALFDQKGIDELDLDVCVLLDRCTDGTEHKLRQLLGDIGVSARLFSCARNDDDSDGARRAALDLLFADGSWQRSDSILFTDADSVVPTDWVSGCVAALKKVDIVAGFPIIEPLREDVADFLDYEDRLHLLERLIYPLSGDTAPSHTRLHGSSLGFSRRAIDEWLSDESEDDRSMCDWIETAPERGLLVQRSRTVIARTSGRLHGRCRRGLSTRLYQLAGFEGERQVRDPELVRRLAFHRRHARLTHRTPYGDKAWQALSKQLGQPVVNLVKAARSYTHAEAFAALCVPANPIAESVPMPVARKQVDEYIRDIGLNNISAT